MEKEKKLETMSIDDAHAIYVAMEELEAARRSFERARRRVMLRRKELQQLEVRFLEPGKGVTHV